MREYWKMHDELQEQNTTLKSRLAESEKLVAELVACLDDVKGSIDYAGQFLALDFCDELKWINGLLEQAKGLTQKTGGWK